MQVIEITDSTNRLLCGRIRSGVETPHGFSVLALSQSGGKGRLGRNFISPPGGIYMSMVLDVNKDYIRYITPMAAVAVRSAILSYTGFNTGIKWVNDLYLNNRKVAGILSEYVLGRVVLGIGVNFSTELPENLKDAAASLYTGSVPEGKTIIGLAGLIESEVLSYCRSLPDKSWLKAYRENEILTGKEVRIVIPDGDELLRGIAAGIDDDGCLLVKKSGGEVVSVSCGEVSARLC